GRDRDEPEAVDAPIDAAIDDDLEAPALAVLGQRAAHRGVAFGVATDRGERGRDVDRLHAHAEVFGEDARAYAAVVGRIAFGQDQREHAFSPERAHRERDAARRIDAARDRDDEAALVQFARGG